MVREKGGKPLEYLYHLPRLYSAVHLSGIQLTRAEEGWSYPNHRHPYFEFLFCASGELEQGVNGRMYRLAAGDAMVIRSGMYHHTRMIRAGEFFDFHFDIDLPDIHMVFQTVEDPLVHPEAGSEARETIREWVESFVGQYGGHFNRVRNLPEAGRAERIAGSVKALQMQTEVLRLIGVLAEYFVSCGGSPEDLTLSRSQLDLAHEAAYRLEQDGENGLNIGELSRQLNVHRTHLTDCFKKVYGVSPRIYLSRLKVRKAQQLLQESARSIEEIAGQLAFSSPGHFSRFFREHTGMSPLAYRNQQQGSNRRAPF